tara:strand:+ start:17 stop:232 length:216 start_codon:yes stop_codon:yes gene_type:complete
MAQATQALAQEYICPSKSGSGTPPVSFVYYRVGQKNYKTKNQNTKKKQNRVNQRTKKTKQTLHLISLKNAY